MTLFELGDETQATPIELDDGYDGQPVLRLRRGATITAGVLRELNDLLGAVAAPSAEPLCSRSTEVASVPVPRGVVRVGRSPDRRIDVSLIGRGLTDTADLTADGALALAEVLRQAAQQA